MGELSFCVQTDCPMGIDSLGRCLSHAGAAGKCCSPTAAPPSLAFVPWSWGEPAGAHLQPLQPGISSRNASHSPESFHHQPNQISLECNFHKPHFFFTSEKKKKLYYNVIKCSILTIELVRYISWIF